MTMIHIPLNGDTDSLFDTVPGPTGPSGPTGGPGPVGIPGGVGIVSGSGGSTTGGGHITIHGGLPLGAGGGTSISSTPNSAGIYHVHNPFNHPQSHNIGYPLNGYPIPNSISGVSHIPMIDLVSLPSDAVVKVTKEGKHSFLPAAEAKRLLKEIAMMEMLAEEYPAIEDALNQLRLVMKLHRPNWNE